MPVIAPDKAYVIASSKDQAVFQTTNPALIIIDVHQSLPLEVPSPNKDPDAESAIASLLSRWRQRKLPIYHIKHSLSGTSTPVQAVPPVPDARIAPGDNENIIENRPYSAFLGTRLGKSLKAKDVTEIVVCGTYTNTTVDTTVRLAADIGYTVYVPHDATMAGDLPLLTGRRIPADDVHWLFLSNLDGTYCTVCSASQLLGQEKQPERFY